MTEPNVAICWLCSRPLGERVDWHHPIPKSRGGRAKVAIHPICHQTLHARFSNGELQRLGQDVATLRFDPEIARFLTWIEDKDPDFHVPTHRRK